MEDAGGIDEKSKREYWKGTGTKSLKAIREMLHKCKTKNDLIQLRKKFESMNKDKYFPGNDNIYEIAKQEIHNALKNYKLMGIKYSKMKDSPASRRAAVIKSVKKK